MKDMVKRFMVEEEGLETVEWGIMLALLVVGLLVTVGLIGGHVQDAFEAVESEFAAETTP